MIQQYRYIKKPFLSRPCFEKHLLCAASKAFENAGQAGKKQPAMPPRRCFGIALRRVAGLLSFMLPRNALSFFLCRGAFALQKFSRRFNQACGYGFGFPLIFISP
jgi:hypothetical protein